MEEQQKQDNAREVQDAANTVVPPPVATSHEVVGGQTQEQEEDECDQKQSGRNQLFSKPSEIGWDRVAELLLTFAIAYFAYAQMEVAKENGSASGKQVDKLIIAADRINDAADSFSASSAAISRGVHDAVGRIQAQAVATEAMRVGTEQNARQSLETTINEFHQEQRAWLGVCGFSLNSFEPGSPVKVSIKFCNTGKSPALHVEEHMRFALTPTALPADSTKDMDIALRSISFEAMNAVPPQGTPTIYGGMYEKVNPDVDRILAGDLRSLLDGSQFLSFFGDVRYRTVFDERVHTTHFCFYIEDARKKQLAYRKAYNELD